MSKRGDGNTEAKVYYTDWDCHICSAEGNFGSRQRCRLCGCIARQSARTPITKGAGKGGKGKGDDAESAKLKRETEKLRGEHQKEVERLKKLLATAKKKGEGGGMEDEEGDSEDEAEETGKELEQARKKRAHIRGMWADDDPMVLELDEKIDSLVRKRDKDKPARVRINVLDRRMAAAKKKVEARAEEVREVEKKLAGLVEERNEKVGQLNAAKQTVEKLKAEHTEELQRALCEGKETPAEADKTMDANAAVALLRRETIARLPKNDPGIGEEIDTVFARLIGLLSSLPNAPTQAVPEVQAESSNKKEDTGEEIKVKEGEAKTRGDPAEAVALGGGPQGSDQRNNNAEQGFAADDFWSSDGEDGCDESMFEDLDLQMLEGESKSDLNKRIANRLAEKLAKRKQERRERKGREGKRSKGKPTGGEAGGETVVKK